MSMRDLLLGVIVNKYSLDDMKLGWIIGDFQPTLLKNSTVEVGVKTFKKGDVEPLHHQVSATEWTCVIQGKIRIGDMVFLRNDIAEIPPLESADFEALEDSILLVIKSPSIPSDKVNGYPKIST